MEHIRSLEARPGDRVTIAIIERIDTYGGDRAVERGQRGGTVVAVDPLRGITVRGDSGRIERYTLNSDAIVRVER